jgi:hypothetical protein
VITEPRKQPTRARNRTSLCLATCRLVVAAFVIAGVVAVVFVAANETARRVTRLVSGIAGAGAIQVTGPVDARRPDEPSTPQLARPARGEVPLAPPPMNEL